MYTLFIFRNQCKSDVFMKGVNKNEMQDRWRQ